MNPQPLSEYEQRCEEKRQENKRMLEALMEKWAEENSDMKQYFNEIKLKNERKNVKPLVQRKRKSDGKFSCRANFESLPRRKSLRIANMKPGVSDNGVDNDDDNDDRENREQTLPIQRRKQVARRRSVPLISPDEITEEELSKIAVDFSSKVYSTEDGTTCHQCRQKTLDQKTVCRSKSCFGITGQFCGVCLKNRYGEDAAKALKDPAWVCPPCRGICTCSICRRRNGLIPTGIMVPFVKKMGFNSVIEYLQANKEDDM